MRRYRDVLRASLLVALLLSLAGCALLDTVFARLGYVPAAPPPRESVNLPAAREPVSLPAARESVNLSAARESPSTPSIAPPPPGGGCRRG